MNGPEFRQRRKDRLAAEFAAANPEEVRSALVASLIEEDVEAARQAIVASWNSLGADLEHAALVADFMSDPNVEELVMTQGLLDWIAENEAALVAASQPYADPANLRTEAWFQAFGRDERALRRRMALTASAAEAAVTVASRPTPRYAEGMDPDGSKRGRLLQDRARALRRLRQSIGYSR